MEAVAARVAHNSELPRELRRAALRASHQRLSRWPVRFELAQSINELRRDFDHALVQWHTIRKVSFIFFKSARFELRGRIQHFGLVRPSPSSIRGLGLVWIGPRRGTFGVGLNPRVGWADGTSAAWSRSGSNRPSTIL